MATIIKNLWAGNGLFWRVARIMLAVVIVSLILLMAFEDKLIFFPTRYPDGYWAVDETLAMAGEMSPQIEDCHFVTSDRVKLHGWYCKPVRRESDKLVPANSDMVLLWFHGNAGNLSYRYDMICALMQLPVQVFIIDYRGYGKSEGKPTERGLYLDARAAWDYLVAERQVPADRIVVFGKSLGGVPAIDLATKVEPAGLIVQSSFTSAADMAATLLPFLPPFILQSKMDSAEKIKQVRCPKLFIHSRADEVVPYKLGQRLFEAAPEPKEFYEVQGSPHNSTYIVGGESYLEALRQFVKQCER